MNMNTALTVMAEENENRGGDSSRLNEGMLVELQKMRERVIDRVDVLERVKAFFLIPQLDMLTTQQVANYYEVDIEIVRKVYQRNREEIDQDGTLHASRGILAGQLVQLENTKSRSTTFDIGHGQQITVSNAGTRVFSKRAILRIGMLLRDSEIAREVRTQLLNTFENATPAECTAAIDEEKELLYKIVKGLTDADTAACLKSLSDFVAYKNRHVTELESSIHAAEMENAALCERIMRWDDRALLNALLRRLAYIKHYGNYSYVWSLWRRTMYYQEKITLLKSSKASYVDQLRAGDWPAAIKVAIVMCRSQEIDVSDILSHAAEGIADIVV